MGDVRNTLYEAVIEKDEALKIGKKLVELRKKYGYTQEKSAQMIGISRTALKNYELGASKPSYESLRKIANFYGVTTDYLLGAEEYQQPEVSPNTQILLQTLKGATEEEIAQAIRIIEALKK